MSKSFWRSLAAGFVLMGVLLGACGGDGGKSGAIDSSQMAPPDQQVLNLRLPGEPRTIDPHLSNFVTEASLMKAVFSGLFSYNDDLKIVANLATEVPTDDNGGVSRDGLTYTVKLAKDAKWSDGKPLTANDFVYSMKRALDPKVAGPYVSFFYGLQGAQEYNTALGTQAAPRTPSDLELAGLRDKVGVTAKDDYTLVYTLKEPNPSFLNLLALWTAYPVRQDVVERYGIQWTEAGNLIGNGPFVLKEWAHNERIVFEPNAYWHGDKPALQRITVSFIADDAAAYAAYLAGELDMTTVPAANRREVATPGSELYDQLIRLPELGTFAMFTNGSVAPFDNVKVRQAFAMAINRTAYVDGVLQGAGRTTTSWLPPGMPGYNAEIGKQWQFNPGKARALLAEAGYPNGAGLPPITFLASATDANRVVGQFIEDQLKTNLNVDATTEYVDSRTFGARFTENQHQVTIARWGADWPYPDNWLPELLGTGKSNNHSGYSNLKFDDLMKQAAKEVDETKRLKLYDDAHKLAIDEAALIPLYNRETFIVVKPKVKGLVITGLDGGIKGDYSFHKIFIAASN